MNITPIHFARLGFVSVNRTTENRDVNNIGILCWIITFHMMEKVFSVTRDGTQIISVMRDRP